jgi:hypothetical protein
VKLLKLCTPLSWTSTKARHGSSSCR